MAVDCTCSIFRALTHTGTHTQTACRLLRSAQKAAGAPLRLVLFKLPYLARRLRGRFAPALAGRAVLRDPSRRREPGGRPSKHSANPSSLRSPTTADTEICLARTWHVLGTYLARTWHVLGTYLGTYLARTWHVLGGGLTGALLL